jgi:hypothetical protein
VDPNLSSFDTSWRSFDDEDRVDPSSATGPQREDQCSAR